MRERDHWWVSQSEAARRLGITRGMVRGMIAQGQLQPVQVGARSVLRRADIEAIRAQWDAPATVAEG